MADVEMPQLGETVTEGTITKWFKQVGDEIAQDEVLFEVSTDKVDSEVPSPAAGFVAEILVAEGDTVDVGTRLAVISDAPPGGSSGFGADAAPAGEGDAAPEPAAAPSAPQAQPEPAAVLSPPQAAPAPGPAAVPAGGDGGRAGVLLSPVVRRLIEDNGLDPASITGTGRGGRITRNDVLALIELGGGQAASVQPETPAGPPAAAPTPQPIARGERDSVVPLNNIRKRTGEHMVMSKQTSPHAMVVTEVDFEAVDRVRRAERSDFKADEGFSLTYLPFISRAVVDAIRDYPHVNAAMGDGNLVVHNYVNLGIAVDLDFEGLIVPVVHDADGKRLRAIAREVSDLAGRARSKTLSADDISGGTFTITNPGPYGTFMTFPVINQPQVAILTTDGVKRRPVVVDDGDGGESIAIHSVGNIGLAWDHRAFDGAYASAFLRAVKEIIETRAWDAEIR